MFQTKALYVQLHDVLAEKIIGGSWKPGYTLANESELSREYRGSIGTVRKALSHLEQDGLVYRRQGRGTYVADTLSTQRRSKFEHVHFLEGQNAAPKLRQIDCKEAAATRDERVHLVVKDRETVVTSRQVVSLDRKPAIYREAHVPRRLIPGFKLTETWDVFSAAQTHGFWVGSAVEKLYLRRPMPHVAAALGIDESATLLMQDRVVSGLNGEPLEWLVSWSEFSQMYYCTRSA